MKNARAGFTLIEIMLVVFVVSVLAAILIPAIARAVREVEVRLDDGRTVTCGGYTIGQCGVSLYRCCDGPERYLCQKSVALTPKTRERSVER
jgi:prepilin-type N-terminal cleavage/methylation domain-containing protein